MVNKEVLGKTTHTTHTTLLLVVAFSDLVAVSLIVPLVGGHLRTLGASHFVIGILGSLYAALQLITSPIIGSWSDIRGHRLILLYTLVVCSACYLLWGLTSSLIVCAVIRFLLGSFKHTQTLCKALIAGSVPHSQHSEMYGKLNAVSGLGFIVGPVVGGHLAEFEDGFFYICCTVALTFWINIGIVYLCIPETVDHPKSQTANNELPSLEGSLIKQQFLKIFHLLQSIEWATFWDIFAFKFLMGYSLAVFHSNYVLYLQEFFDIGVKWVGYTISFQGMIGAISSMLIGHLRVLYKNDPLLNMQMLHAFIGLALSFCILALASDWRIFVMGLVFLSASAALLRVLGMEMLLLRTEVSKRGSLVGSSNSISSIARLVAPVSVGLIHTILGFNGMFVLSVLVSIAGVILSYYLYKKQQPKSKKN